MNKCFWLLVGLLLVSSQVAAVNRCKDSAGKVTYQEQPCESDASQSKLRVWQGGEASGPASANASQSREGIGLVSLQEATIIIRQMPGGSFASLTLQPRWKNDNPAKVTIYYKTQFFDAAKTEIGVDNRFKELDPKSVSTSTQVIGTSSGKATDSFDYKKIAQAVITYRVGRDAEDKKFTQVVLKRVSE